MSTITVQSGDDDSLRCQFSLVPCLDVVVDIVFVSFCENKVAVKKSVDCPMLGNAIIVGEV